MLNSLKCLIAVVIKYVFSAVVSFIFVVMVITTEMIDQLANLAMLEFNDNEKAELKSDMEKMIGFIEKLNEIDTAGVEPLLYITPNINELRDDILQGSASKEDALLNAPLHNETFFMVPKVIRK